MQKTPPITEFTGQWQFLSNFSPHPVVVAGVRFPTAEHVFQAMKTTNPQEREHVRTMETPGRAKRAGRKVTIRPDWEQIKVEVMLKVVRMKFQQNTELRRRLLQTGERELVEGNSWGDTFWGVCHGEGRNELGKILMRVREEL